MGCASSIPSQDREDIFSEVKKPDPPMIKTAPPGNNAKPTSAGQQNGHTTICQEEQEKLDREKSILRGDVVKKYEARAEREKQMREKQRKMALAAEVMSAQVLDDRERLSLTSRSRATSRATSRTASPTGGARSQRDKTTHPSLPNILPEREEGKGDQSNSEQHDNVRVIS